MGEILGEQTALGAHALGIVAVGSGIEAVEPVRQHRGRGQVVLQGGTVGTDVHTVGQSAHHEHALHLLGQPLQQLGHHGTSVVGDAARAHHAERVAGVARHMSLHEELRRGILTVGQQLRIVGIGQGEYAHPVFLAVVRFLLRTVEGFAAGIGVVYEACQPF